MHGVSAPLPLERLEAGQVILVGSDRYVTVDDELAAAFAPGDRLIAVAESGDLLHIPELQYDIAERAVADAVGAFAALEVVSDDQITAFFDAFASRLADDSAMADVLAANERDVAAAAAAGRSTTRLVLTPRMREDMIAGLRGWSASSLRRNDPVGHVDHDGWSVDARKAPLGVVAFVFEGRPNVFADAAGVVRTGNAVVMRIGSDALGTAEAIVTNAVEPALAASGLPPGTMSLVRSKQRSAGWALFALPGVALAVARGSGFAVAQLGAVARQSGTPVSLHGTGGAWLVAGESADAGRFAASVIHSLDRKVCNTLNVCCIPRQRIDLVPVFLDAVDKAAAALGTAARLHVERGSIGHVPPERFESTVPIRRADGERTEYQATPLEEVDLGIEWEWEASPELSLVVTDTVGAAVDLCNRYSPRFVASLIADDDAEQHQFYAAVDAPFVGDGFTRWVDGQYALDTPELGLSNWQFGRLLARGGVLSGDSVFTIRHRATVDDPDLHR
jgi:glutamate-5-semialdehyde dehydrogenase